MTPPVTQIHYLAIGEDKDLSDSGSGAGKPWSRALNLLEDFAGFRRLYWGRSPEDETKVQLHIVRNELSQHQDFLKSPQYSQFKAILQDLMVPSTEPFVRHAYLKDFTPSPQSLAKGAPFTGSAIYVGTDEAWDHAWPLWTHIVRYVDGCLGCTGGKVLESVDGFENNYIVYVGWESIKKHDDYHHTKHFAKNGIVLRKGNKGYREYGHVRFEGSRERVKGNL